MDRVTVSCVLRSSVGTSIRYTIITTLFAHRPIDCLLSKRWVTVLWQWWGRGLLTWAVVGHAHLGIGLITWAVVGQLDSRGAPGCTTWQWWWFCAVERTQPCCDPVCALAQRVVRHDLRFVPARPTR